MRNTLWTAISLLLFGAVVAMITASGAYDVTISGMTSPFDEETVTQLTESAASMESNPLGGITLLPVLLKTVFGGLIAIISIIPALSSLGIPIWISAVFQGPIWIIYIVDLVALIKGFQVS
jgi:hypothetical protein